MKYQLGRLFVKNFKAIEEQLIDLRTFQTAILDGPNGFGKTTIFDALELCFTGRIGRVNTSKAFTSTKAHDSHFLKRNSSEPTIVLLELQCDNPDHSFAIKVEIAANISGSAASVKKYEEHINRYIGKAWNTTNWEKLSNSQLEEILQIKSLAALFPVQHYISQEDTARFLRDCDESQRHKTLSHLFGTSVQSDEMSVIALFKEKLAATKGALREKIQKLNTDLAKISVGSAASESSLSPNPSGFLESVTALANPSHATLANVSSMLESLEALLPTVLDPTTYVALRFNELIDTLSSSREQELLDVLTIGSLTDSRNLVRLQRARRSREKHLQRLHLYRRTRDLVIEDNGEISDRFLGHLAPYFSKSTTYRSLSSSLSSLRQQSTNSAKLLERLQSHRTALLDAYKRLHAEKADEHVACPFCGEIKEGQIDQLLMEYQQQEEFYASQGSANSTSISVAKSKVEEEFLTPLLSRIERRIQKLKWLEDEKIGAFFDLKPVDETRFERMTKVRNWLFENNIDFLDLIDEKVLVLSSGYLERREELRRRLRSKKRDVPDELVVDTEEIKRNYLAIGIANDKTLLALPADGMTSDIAFLRHMLQNLKNVEVQRLQKELNSVTVSAEKIRVKLLAADAILKIYTDNIKKYEIQVASTIAIPFYIYTSKVLQTRLDGSGIFLKTPIESGKEKNPYIRFCARKTDTHDAWCTMSSGQLAGLVICFALVMNRLYPSRLNAILVDDPVQSMDEINMASLVQLFLHEFPEHQFVVSTHERNISSYISYKFTSQGQNVAHINMKERAQSFK
jgi:exonuclease SbcC